MEKRTLRIMFSKNGNGFKSYRVNLPTPWIEDLEITENDREVNVYKLNDRIIITKGEIEMDEKLILTQVIEECKKEMERAGFICNSDNVERFIDEEVRKAIVALSNEDTEEDNIEDQFDEICEQVNDYMKNNYKEVGECDERGDYKGYFYDNKLEFEDVKTLEKHFLIGE